MIDQDANLREAVKALSVRWMATLPVMDLQPLKATLAPSGEWVADDRVAKVFKLVAERLHALRSDAMGETRIVFSRDLTKAALAQVAPRQGRLGIPAKEELQFPLSEHQDGHADVSQIPSSNQDRTTRTSTYVDSDTFDAHPAAELSRDFDDEQIQDIAERALATCERIEAEYANGNIANAETFLDHLKSSPDPRLTIRALGESHKDVVVVAGTTKCYTSGGQQKFPNVFETQAQFRIVFHKFSNSNPEFIEAYIDSYTREDNHQVRRDLLLTTERRHSLSLRGSSDGLLVRHAALDDDASVEAIVTGTLSVASRTIVGLTLVRVVNKSRLLPAIERISAQLELKLGSISNGFQENPA